MSSPRILVLLTTHNGADYLPAQLDSLIGQRDVALHILVSDDASTDDTCSILTRYAEDAPAQFTLLPPGEFGSAAANFFRLIREADATGFEAVAFCDQDDIWQPDKLARHWQLLCDSGYAAVSSNVIAFDAAGTRQLIVKSQPQRPGDYAFESAGPGSTFLLRHDSFALVQRQLRDASSAANHAPVHDWLVYALVRASGGRWHIDPSPSVEYRQHEANVLGANEGVAQNLRRLAGVRSGDYRRAVRAIVAAAREVADDAERPRLEWLHARLDRLGPLNRLRLLRHVGALRRRSRDRLALAGFILLGLF